MKIMPITMKKPINTRVSIIVEGHSHIGHSHNTYGHELFFLMGTTVFPM